MRAQSRQIGASSARTRESDHLGRQEEPREVATVEVRAWKNGKNIGAADALEVRAGDLGEVRPQLSVEEVLRRERELATCQLPCVYRADADKATTGLDVLEPDVQGAALDRSRIHDVTLNYCHVIQRDPFRRGHPSIPSNSDRNSV